MQKSLEFQGLFHCIFYFPPYNQDSYKRCTKLRGKIERKEKLRKSASSKFIVFTLIFFSLLACGEGKKKKGLPTAKDKIYPVSVIKPEIQEVPEMVDLSGTFIANDTLIVKSEFSGKASGINVIEGGRVNPGDTLITISNDSLNLVLDKQRAELREEELKLETALNHSEDGDEIDDDNSIKPKLTPKIRPKPRRNPFDDPDEIGEDDEPINEEPEDVADQDKEDPEHHDEEDNAEKPKRVNVNGMNIPLQQAKIETLRAQVALSEKQVSEGTILSTISGIIERKFVTEGSLVQPGNELFKIINIDPIQLSVFIPQKYIAKLKKSTPVKVFLPEQESKAINGELAFISSEYNTSKKGLEVRISCSNGSEIFRVQMEGIARLALSDKKITAYMIPNEAIHKENGNNYVYVASDQVARKQEVSLGASKGNLSAVLKGISDDDQIIIKGHETFDEDEEFIKIQ